MPFSRTTKDEAFERSGGRCECTRQHSGEDDAPHHGGRCPNTFTKDGGEWEAHHIIAEKKGGENILSNCEALCIDCHHLTETYGN